MGGQVNHLNQPVRGEVKSPTWATYSWLFLLGSRVKFEKQRKTKWNKVANLDAFRSGFQTEAIASQQTMYYINNAPQFFPLQTHKCAAGWPSQVLFWVTGCPLGRAWANSGLVSELKLPIHWKYFLQYSRASCKSIFLLAGVHLTTILCISWCT